VLLGHGRHVAVVTRQPRKVFVTDAEGVVVPAVDVYGDDRQVRKARQLLADEVRHDIGRVV